MRNELPVVIYGDGRQIRDYVYVDDVADAICQLVMNNVDVDIVNVGSGLGNSVAEVVDTISALTGTTPLLERQPASKHDVQSIILDITKLKSLIDYRPRTLHAGIRDLLAAESDASVSIPHVA